MQKIASPRELQAELKAIMAFIHHSEKPDRSVIAAKLNELADRIEGRRKTAGWGTDFERMVYVQLLNDKQFIKLVAGWLGHILKHGEGVDISTLDIDKEAYDLVYHLTSLLTRTKLFDIAVETKLKNLREDYRVVPR